MAADMAQAQAEEEALLQPGKGKVARHTHAGSEGMSVEPQAAEQVALPESAVETEPSDAVASARSDGEASQEENLVAGELPLLRLLPLGHGEAGLESLGQVRNVVAGAPPAVFGSKV